MSTGSELTTIGESGWRRGLPNLFSKENRAWWGTRKWWVQSLIWLVIINGIMAIMIWLVPEDDPQEAIPMSEVKDLYIIFFAIFSSIGVIVLNQSAIVGEKQSGTAEWIMSNPVSRSAFLLSKLLANGLAILFIVVILQSAVFYLQMTLKESGILEPGPFTAAMTLMSLNLLFFLTLTLMLGTFFNSRGPVTGIALAVFIGQGIVSDLLSQFWAWIPLIFPDALMEAAQATVNGRPLPSVVPIIITFSLSLIFVFVANWRFKLEEF